MIVCGNCGGDGYLEARGGRNKYVSCTCEAGRARDQAIQEQKASEARRDPPTPGQEPRGRSVAARMSRLVPVLAARRGNKPPT